MSWLIAIGEGGGGFCKIGHGYYNASIMHPIKRRFCSSFISVFTPLKWSLRTYFWFLYLPIFKSVAKKNRKNIGGAFDPPLHPPTPLPQLHLCLEVHIFPLLCKLISNNCPALSFRRNFLTHTYKCIRSGKIIHLAFHHSLFPSFSSPAFLLTPTPLHDYTWHKYCWNAVMFMQHVKACM